MHFVDNTPERFSRSDESELLVKAPKLAQSMADGSREDFSWHPYLGFTLPSLCINLDCVDFPCLVGKIEDWRYGKILVSIMASNGRAWILQ